MRRNLDQGSMKQLLCSRIQGRPHATCLPMVPVLMCDRDQQLQESGVTGTQPSTWRESATCHLSRLCEAANKQCRFFITAGDCPQINFNDLQPTISKKEALVQGGREAEGWRGGGEGRGKGSALGSTEQGRRGRRGQGLSRTRSIRAR